ncbi:MAG: RadC family protein [Kiritimatiellia bacterium]|jgi:DNA repair protein RadC
MKKTTQADEFDAAEDDVLYRLRDLPACQRPRELLERFGVDSVEDEVLLAIILRSGTRGLNVLELARRLLQRYGSLSELATASERELQRPGIGPVKAQVLKAALELGRRLANEKLDKTPSIRTPADVAALLREEVRVLKKENFWVLLLNTKNRLIGQPVIVSQGLLNSSPVHPREVFNAAIQASCAAVILVHNHPSGDPAPSEGDISVTRRLVAAGEIIGVRVLDHVVLGRAAGAGQDFVSMREKNLVDFPDT